MRTVLLVWEAAEPLAHPDLLPWIQAEAEVFWGLKQENNGGAQVKFSQCFPLSQDHTLSLQGDHGPLTWQLQDLVADDKVVVIERPFTVVRTVCLKILFKPKGNGF